MAGIDVRNHQLVNAIPKDQKGNPDQVIIDSTHDLTDQQIAVGMREPTLQNAFEHAQFGVGADDEAAETAEQTHHHGNQCDQSVFPDQRLEVALHPCTAAPGSTHLSSGSVPLQSDLDWPITPELIASVAALSFQNSYGCL